MENEIVSEKSKASAIISVKELMEHWQGHRRLTRKLIEVFPDEHFYTFSIGGMRPCSELIMELLVMAAPGAKGLVTGNWQTEEQLPVDFSAVAPPTKAEVLALWDRSTEQMNAVWTGMRPERFQETDAAFGMFTNKVINSLFYLIDNENHHRGQAYVYLRALGIEPPAFWDRE